LKEGFAKPLQSFWIHFRIFI